VRYTIYEHPSTHQFAIVKLPAKFLDGDRIPVPSTVRWFQTHEEALATLSELFDEDERTPECD
jgi:hypothetical protein